MSAPESYQILTLEDIVLTYAKLPADRGELLLKEIGDAVRIMAPLVEVLKSPYAPLTWINDVKGTATVTLSTPDKSFVSKTTFDLPKRAPAKKRERV